MRKLAFHGIFALLTLAAGIACIAACDQRQEVAADKPGSERQVVVQRGAQGTEVEFHHEEAQRNLDQAGRDLGRGASELGRALAHGAQEVGKEVAPVAKDAGRQLAEGAREVGQKLGPAAREAGQQLQQAGQEVGQRVGPALSDAAITTRIKAKLLADSQLNGQDINVETAEGQVTLSGRVATPGQKAEAEKVALRTAGVRRVVNNLGVGG
ncbi:MAG: hyperosmotically inducible periplasmic protein [Acidobacteriota bacterium]|jgi:hyperosmotically inducible protein|nr:hyperosmotically inducible periplasmic protein [Acidobacteriota bacterium]